MSGRGSLRCGSVHGCSGSLRGTRRRRRDVRLPARYATAEKVEKGNGLARIADTSIWGRVTSSQAEGSPKQSACFSAN